MEPEKDRSLVIQALAERLTTELRQRREEIARRGGLTLGRRNVLGAAGLAPRTVPQIARILGQARQSVQRTADLLAVEGLCAFEPNPDHKRSPRIRPTPKGRDTLSRLGLQEAQLIPPWGDHLEEEEMETAALVLASLLDLLGVDPGR